MKMKPSKTNSDALSAMSLDNFFETMDHDGSDDEEVNTVITTKKSKKKVESVEKKPKLKVKTKKAPKPSPPSDSDSDSEDAEQESSHKSALTKLQNTDPELFKFLEQNDMKLLKFGGGEDEVSESDQDEDNSKVHKPSNDLEVASDESDYEDEDKPSKKDANTITLKMLKAWQEDLGSENVSIETIRSAIKAFNSALITISGEDGAQGAYKVEGAAIFNGIIQLCVLNLEKAIRTFLKLSSKSNFKEIQKCKRFSKVKSVLRSYLLDLTKLLESVTSSNILSIVLKHLHQLGSVLAAFSSITKPILKRLILIWSSSEESVRILAFLCILKITRSQPDYTLNQVLKNMYMEYVKNSKFVSKNTVPAINFMRRSLTEMFVLDLNVAYQHVFLFVRQLAIHLRNAILLQKKEHFQQIYNWQYVNSLKLWGDVLSNISISAQGSAKAESRSKLVSLIYPFVSIVTGVIKLKSSANYFPLRFQCVKILIDLSRATNVYIPTLPFILEVLNSNSFKQQHKKLSMKPISFACALRIQKGQLDENAFRDETIEQVFGLTLECLLNDCTSISFPDLVVPHVMALNQFIKSTKNTNYAKKLKQLHDKIIEQANYVDVRRNKISFSLNDMNYIKSWEANLRTGTSPLEVFHATWDKSNKQKIKRQITDTEDGADHDYGNLPKIVGPANKKAKTDGEPVVLFPSDDESESSENFEACSDDFESDNSEEEAPPVKKQVKSQTNGKKKKPVAQYDSEDENKTYFDDGDIVEDLAIENW